MLILKRIGYFFLDNWKIIVPVIVLLFLAIFVWRSCSARKARLEQQEKIEAIKAIAEQDRQKMIEILVNSDIREKAIDANVSTGRQEVLEAVNASRRENANKSNEELAAELNRRAQE